MALHGAEAATTSLPPTAVTSTWPRTLTTQDTPRMTATGIPKVTTPMAITWETIAMVIPTMTLMSVTPSIEIPLTEITCIQGMGLTMTTMQTTHQKTFMTHLTLTTDTEDILTIQAITGNLLFLGTLGVTGNPHCQGIMGITGNPHCQGILEITGNLHYQGILEITRNPLSPENKDMEILQRIGSTTCPWMIPRGTIPRTTVTLVTHRTPAMTSVDQMTGMEMSHRHSVITTISRTGNTRDFLLFTVTHSRMIRSSSSRWWCREVALPPLSMINMVSSASLWHPINESKLKGIIWWNLFLKPFYQ